MRPGTLFSKIVFTEEERLRLLKRDVALDVYYEFIDFTPCSDDGDGVDGSIAQLACLDAWMETVVTYLPERERQKSTNKSCTQIHTHLT